MRPLFHFLRVMQQSMNPETIFIRLSSGSIAPRLNASTAAPRAADRVQQDLQPLFEQEKKRYKRHYDEAFQNCLGSEWPGGPAFPEDEPELRVTDRIMGSKGIQGASMVEQVPETHSVVNIAEAVVKDPAFTLQHEFAHTSLSQRGIDLGREEEKVADCVAQHVINQSK